MQKIEKNYWVEIKFLNDFFVAQVLKNRIKMYSLFEKNVKFNSESKVLDIGTTPLLDNHENIFVNRYPWKHNITCISNQDCSILKTKYPEIKTEVGDAKKINFSDSSFDIVHCSATVEHVGSFNNQVQCIKEMYRLAKNSIFITTPNRNFPIDFHTKYPLIHLLPKKIHRKILSIFGDKFFQFESNLNLLNHKDLVTICNELKIAKYQLLQNKYLYMNSNLILILNK